MRHLGETRRGEKREVVSKWRRGGNLGVGCFIFYGGFIVSKRLLTIMIVIIWTITKNY